MGSHVDFGFNELDCPIGRTTTCRSASCMFFNRVSVQLKPVWNFTRATQVNVFHAAQQPPAKSRNVHCWVCVGTTALSDLQFFCPVFEASLYQGQSWWRPLA